MTARIRVLFDCRLLKCFFTGTHEHIRALLTAFAARHANRFEIGVLCDAAAFAFHGLDTVAGLARRDAADARGVALALRPGQPFEQADLAPLGDFGATTGFMLADQLATAVRPHDLNGTVPASRVTLTAAEPAGMSRALLDALRPMVAGATVAVTVAGAASDVVDEAHLRVLLLASGCQPLSITDDGDAMIASGVVCADWKALLPGPQKDADFVRYLYRQALGRNPDIGGGRHYLDELRRGAARGDLLSTFLCSPERHALVAQQIKAFDRAAG